MELYEYQKINLQEMIEIFSVNDFCINISPTGLGKSVVSFELSKNFKNLFVISTEDILNQVWRPLSAEAILISIEKWRGRRKCELRHPYLTRSDTSAGTNYEITSKLKELIENNTLFIFDEFQFIKNKNKCYQAINILIENIKGSNSKCLFLSATPIDKPKQKQNYIDLLGQFDEIICYMEYEKKNNIEGYNIFADIVVPFYDKKFQDKEIQLEKAKIPIFCQRALKYLEKGFKVILAVIYIETIEILLKKLENYKPLRLDGSNKENRNELIKNFQQNDFKYPLIIANLSVISTGISLDDKYGDFPRAMIISPNNFVMKTKQLAHRIDRVSTKSKSIVEIIFARNLDEKRVRELLFNKAEIMKKYCKEDGMFPNDYVDINF